MAFREETAAFFDELTNIVDEQMKDRQQGMEASNESPFSSMLTRDEEPIIPQQEVLEPFEPEVITRQGV
jgi:hypothetical protein